MSDAVTRAIEKWTIGVGSPRGVGGSMARVQAGKFDLETAQKGYALNKMCHTLNAAESRTAFSADEDGYCARFGLSDEEREAVRSRNKPHLFELGGNMYFLAKLDRVPKR
jgi:protocatechuate 4,5-dioxygenase alpha subunit